MRDLHCHILPGVDDGARDHEESLRMLDAARSVGVTSMVCTPHCRSSRFDYDAILNAYAWFAPQAQERGIEASLGFEVAHSKLLELGLEWIDRLAFDNGKEFLLELDVQAPESMFAEYQRTIFAIQGRGLKVIIAHPERYRAIKRNINLAHDLVRNGCFLQASADFINGGRLGAELKLAKRLFKEGLYSYIASDAHCPEHYDALSLARSIYHTRGKHMRLMDVF